MPDHTRILLIEDNCADAHLIELFFKMADPAMWIDRVADGDEAIRYLRNDPPVLGSARPDFVLLDLSLPGKSGLEVLREMKRNEKLRSIPVVILSGSTNELDMLKGFELEAKGFVRKPAGIQEFAQSIKRIVDLELPLLKRAAGLSWSSEHHSEGSDTELSQ